MDCELPADWLSDPVDGVTLVLALVRMVNVPNDDLLTKALVLHLGARRHERVKSTPLDDRSGAETRGVNRG